MLLEDLTAKCGHFNCGLSAVPISENAKGEKWFFYSRLTLESTEVLIRYVPSALHTGSRGLGREESCPIN
jgi:hypothetical protein